MSFVGEFDYIVVGSGSAGGVLANRLTACGRHNVLLIEAGGEDRNPWIHVPIGFPKLFFDTRVVWGDTGSPEPELKGRSLYYPHGKVLGGSSSVNGMIYIRGQSADYDHWRQLGNTGWGYSDVLPYFKKAEDQQHGANTYHGIAGPISVHDHPKRHELCEAYIEAAQQVGIPRNYDFNGTDAEGAGYYQLTTNGWRRSSTAVGYLRSARKRRNLTVLTKALATRILLKERRAVGVEFRRGGEIHQARAKGEVILSSGVFNSPHLLQLSGIGAADRLSAAGIAVIHDLPGVGEHLEDHYIGVLVYECTKALTLNDSLRTLRGRIGMALSYGLFRTGLMTIGASYAGGFYRTDPQANRADVQNFFMIYSSEGYRKPDTFSGISVGVFQSRPESKGWVRTISPDPMARPEIRFNYLSTEGDRKTLTAGIALTRRIMTAPAMAPYIKRPVNPAADVVTDSDLLDWARANGGSGFHGTGTCRMGADGLAVVDARLRVHGIGGLRVADGSVMPSIVSGNTNAPIIMIGEKAADLILEDARRV